MNVVLPALPSPLSAALSWASDWWELWALMAVGLAGVRLTPALVARSERPAALPDEVARAVERAGVPTDRVGVLRRDGRVLAYAAGLTAGHGRVFVSTGLLRELDAAGVAAVVRHEYAHLARRHVPLRLGIPCAYAVAWAVYATLFRRAGLVAGAGLAVPLALPPVRVPRWTGHDACPPGPPARRPRAPRPAPGPGAARAPRPRRGAARGACAGRGRRPRRSRSGSDGSTSNRTAAATPGLWTGRPRRRLAATTESRPSADGRRSPASLR